METLVTAPHSERLLYSLEQSSECLGGLGRTTIFELIRKGELQIVKIGRRTFITRKSLNDFVEAKVTPQGGEAWSTMNC